MIIDYSTARPSVTVLKAAGVTAAGRYIGWDSVPGFPSIGKNITRAEAGHLLAAGISVFLVFEYQADAALKGHAQGVKDGELASSQLREIGAPAGMTVYFAVDFDIPDFAIGAHGPAAKLGPAAEYFRGIHDSHPAYTVGVYGGYWAVSRCLDAALAGMGWQTTAWSPRDQDGNPVFDARAVLRQQLGTPLPGADLDTVRLNTAHGPDFGQWPRPPLPKPSAPALETHVTAGHLSLHDLAAQRGTTAAHILRLTAKWDAFTPETYAWINAIFADTGPLTVSDPMPAGLTLRCPVLPS